VTGRFSEKSDIVYRLENNRLLNVQLISKVGFLLQLYIGFNVHPLDIKYNFDIKYLTLWMNGSRIPLHHA
jgi:hypothetical protein